ncbi:MAG: energy transducer TonB, partial [Acidobacteriota bacterium]|nr:energy transducer TonB [Acidobacteriota bacterium]
LEVVILKSGRVGPARVIRSLDAGLDAKAIAAVREWTFQPGRYRGEAVDVLAEIEVEFRLL